MQSVSSIINKNISKEGGLLNTKINGFTKVPNLFLMRQDINIYEKMIMIILKKYKMNKTLCWPSLKTIAEKARCSETTVKETIKKLENKELLIKSRDKKFKSNVYEVKM